MKKSDPAELTSKGSKTRDSIEEETNLRSEEGFKALDEEDAQRFMRALKAMPG